MYLFHFTTATSKLKSPALQTNRLCVYFKVSLVRSTFISAPSPLKFCDVNNVFLNRHLGEKKYKLLLQDERSW